MTITTLPQMDMVRNLALGTMISTCTIKRATTLYDATGSPYTTYADYLTDVPCGIMPLGMNQDIKGDVSVIPINKYQLRVPPGTELRLDDQIMFENILYEIVQINALHGFSLFQTGIIQRRIT